MSLSKFEHILSTFHDRDCRYQITLFGQRLGQTNCIINLIVVLSIKLDYRDVISKFWLIIAGVNEDFRGGKFSTPNLDVVSVEWGREESIKKSSFRVSALTYSEVFAGRLAIQWAGTITCFLEITVPMHFNSSCVTCASLSVSK